MVHFKFLFLMSTTLQSAEHKKRNKILVYCLASAEEQDECEAIQKYLSPVIRNSKIPIEIISDFVIPAGEDKEKYKQRLYEADIVLAFISADFINDDETYYRTQKVMAKYNSHETIMLPILVRNCLWKSTPFVNLPLLPKNFQPLNNKQFWNSEDDAFTAVVTDIYDSINSFTYEETLPPSSDVEFKEVTEQVQRPASVIKPPIPAEKPVQPLSAFETQTGTERGAEHSSPEIESETILKKPLQQSSDIGDTQSTNKMMLVQPKTIIPLEIDWRKKYYKDAFWKRGMAFFLDNLLTLIPVTCIAFLIAVIFITIEGLNEEQDDVTDGQLLFVILFTLISYFLVCAAMESSKWRGTFGKRIMKLQITDKKGHPISFFRALWRNIMRFVIGYSYLTLIPLVIQYFTFKKTRQLFHDQLSYTVIGEKLTG